MRNICMHYFTRILMISATVSVISFKLTKEDVSKFLTQAGLASIEEDPNLEHNFAISFPHFHKIDENDPFVQRLSINVPHFNKSLDLDLVLNNGLLSKNFIVLESFTNRSVPLRLEEGDSTCYYRGRKSAVSLCNGVRGIIHFDDNEYYLIHPLPKELHKNGHKKPHVVVRKYYNRKTCPYHNHNSTLDEDLSFPALDQHFTVKNDSNLTLAPIRKKRETFSLETPVFVETAVFVDKDLFEHMKINFPSNADRELIRFVLAMINAVQLLYHDPSLGRPINFLLKRLEILKEEVTGLTRSPDIDRFLSNFCSWQQSKNPAGDDEPQHWDHALILTGLDLYVRSKHGKISNQVVGLAPVAGMCTPTSSCTVNEGKHFESVYVVAHEIGHNLGMRHDGPLAENECDPTSYIMSPTLGSGKITWSTCSKNYLQKFLDTTQSHCLLDHGSSAGQLDHSAEGALPGERFDLNRQCMLKYGYGSQHSSQQPLNDVCRDLHCERDRYTWTSHPALEGSECGSNMWCKRGKCILRTVSNNYAFSHNSLVKPLRAKKILGVWSKWKPFTECASGCLYGEEGQLHSGSIGIMTSMRTCNSFRIHSAGNSCNGINKKYQTCNAPQCFNIPRLTVKRFADQICFRAKIVDKDLNGVGVQKTSSDREEACLVWCQMNNGGTKSRGWTFPDGTVCHTGLSKYGQSSYCINGRCENFYCDTHSETAFIQMPELCPNHRMDNEIMSLTSLSNKPENTEWKRASNCHFNCISPGSGIRLVIKDNKKHGRTSIQLCQPDQLKCGKIKSPFQHASMLCSKYKERVRRLSGLGMQILPVVEDPDRPCKVACQDENISHRFYLVNGEEGWFPFGTDCSKNFSSKKAYCISGKCLEFGADGTPVSKNEFTLSLFGRTRRSITYKSTKVIAKLNQEQLDEIVLDLNRTLSGDLSKHRFDLDLSNPIDINMEMYPLHVFPKHSNFSG